MSRGLGVSGELGVSRGLGVSEELGVSRGLGVSGELGVSEGRDYRMLSISYIHDVLDLNTVLITV